MPNRYTLILILEILILISIVAVGYRLATATFGPVGTPGTGGAVATLGTAHDLAGGAR